MTIHPPDCECTDSYGCRKRREGYGYVSRSATPTRTYRHDPKRRPRFNSWEAGVAGEHRPDGSFMPYVHADGSKIHTKEMADNRRQLEGIRARQIQGPTPQRSDP